MRTTCLVSRQVVGWSVGGERDGRKSERTSDRAILCACVRTCIVLVVRCIVGEEVERRASVKKGRHARGCGKERI